MLRAVFRRIFLLYSYGLGSSHEFDLCHGVGDLLAQAFALQALHIVEFLLLEIFAYLPHKDIYSLEDQGVNR